MSLSSKNPRPGYHRVPVHHHARSAQGTAHVSNSGSPAGASGTATTTGAVWRLRRRLPRHRDATLAPSASAAATRPASTAVISSRSGRGLLIVAETRGIPTYQVMETSWLNLGYKYGHGEHKRTKMCVVLAARVVIETKGFLWMSGRWY